MCYLLRIRSPEELLHRAERGAIFETFVVSELYKNFLNRGEQPGLYYWREAGGHEVDIIIELGDKIIAVETKSAQTIASDFFNNLNYWMNVSGDKDGQAALIYGGDESFKRSGVFVYPWFVL